MSDLLNSFSEGMNIAGSLKATADATQLKSDAASTLKDAFTQEQSTAASNQSMPGSKPQPNMFNVYNMAAQSAIQKGQPALAEKYFQEASVFKKDNIEDQQRQVTQQKEKVEKAINDFQTVQNPQDALKMLMDNNDVPIQQKQQMVSQLISLGNSPEKFKEWRDGIDKAHMTAKERVTAEEKRLQDEIKLMREQERERYDREQTAIAAKKTSALEIKAGVRDAKADNREAKRDEKESKKDVQIAEDHIAKAETEYNKAADAAKVDPKYKKDPKALKDHLSNLEIQRDEEIQRQKKRIKEAQTGSKDSKTPEYEYRTNPTTGIKERRRIN